MTTMRPMVGSRVDDDAEALRARLDSDGYLFVRDLAPRDDVLHLRRDVLELCRAAGWVDPSAPPIQARWSGAGPFTEGEPPYMALYRQVIHLPSFRALPEHARFVGFVETLIDAPVLVHQRKIGRITFPNNQLQATGAHQDFFYIRGTQQTYTIWVPLGDCPIELGGLAVLRGSHRFGFLEHQMFPGKKYAGHGLADQQLPTGAGIEWHASDFALGDALLFHAHTIHKALPNQTADTLRLSIDNRYQRAGDAIEPGSMGTHYNL